MRPLTRDSTPLADLADPPGSELLDALPDHQRPEGANSFTAWLWLALRLLGGLAVLATGAVHLYEYEQLYSMIPTIGTLFLLNFIGATAIGLGLLAPVERFAGRHRDKLLLLLVVAGIGLALVAFAFLKISQHTPLFGFVEPGYDPAGIDAAQGAEVAAVVLLCTFLARKLWSDPPMRRW